MHMLHVQSTLNCLDNVYCSVCMCVSIPNYGCSIMFQLLSMGVHHSVLAVTSQTAGQFEFCGQPFFSRCALASGRVCAGDGVVLLLAEGGVAGVRTLWR